MKGKMTYGDLESVFDWRLFASVCGIRVGGELTPEASVALESFKSEALSYLCPESHRPSPAAEWCVRFFRCRREGEAIVSDDGTLRLPMLRQGSGGRRSLCDLFPSNPELPPVNLGLFAIKVDAPDGDANSLIAHAARVTMAEATSEFMRLRFQKESGIKTFLPAVGYPCCPDHSLKRDILQRLDIDIRLTDSCAMIPEASICGLVISSEKFSLFDIRNVLPEELDAYAKDRAFTDFEKQLYLYSVMP